MSDLLARVVTLADVRRVCRQLDVRSEDEAEMLARLSATAAVAAADADPSAGVPTPCEAEMMALLKCPKPERLVHDLRNVLNELSLLKATMAMD